MLLNPIGKSRMNFRLSSDCFSSWKNRHPNVLKSEDARRHSRGPSRPVTKSRERAKRALWWPGLNRQIDDRVKQCGKKEPMIPRVVPDRPWQVIGTNICYMSRSAPIWSWWPMSRNWNSSRSISWHHLPRLKRYVPWDLCLQDMVYRRWFARTTAPSTTLPSLPNLPGNSNMLPVVPSMPNPTGKRNGLFKQRRTCCRWKVTLRKLFCLSIHTFARWKEPVWATVRPLDSMKPFLASQRLSNPAGPE